MADDLRRLVGVPRVVVTPSAGRRARPVVALAGAADWRRATLDRLAAQLLTLGATAALPRAPGWSWPDLELAEIERVLTAPTTDHRLGNVRVLGAVFPRQAGRARLSLLAEADGATVVVKLGRPDTGIEREATVLRLLSDAPLPGISTPVVIASGTVADVTFLATAATDLVHQRAAIDEPLRTFEADLGDRLATLDRPAGTPDGHVPAHGDLTPWNLRRTPRGLALFDWEAACWAPPGSDVEFYRSACESLPRRRLGRRR